jgi:poly-gamma-glutamate capsule biosynthesis protein CapA/YwtB (metallophosphatase superfamily)
LASAPAAATEIKLSAVGDMIFGNTPSLPSEPKHYLDSVDTQIRANADIVFANLEGTLTTATVGKCGHPNGGDCFNFRNPPHYAKYFKADGFTILNNANNHSHDFGRIGLDQTVTAIHRAGMKQTGLPGQITLVQAGGQRVAIVGFAPYSGTADMLRLDDAAALIRTARTKARVVVVYMHAGAEGSDRQHVTGDEEYYVGEDRGNAEKFAHLAIRNGASLVIASGPHVLRGMQFYRGHLIAYSLGNFANFHNFGGGGVLSDSTILHVRLGPTGKFLGGKVVPVLLDGEGHPRIGGPSVKVVRALSKADFGSHAARFGRHGVIRRPA